APVPIHVKALTGISLWQNFKDMFQGARGRRAFSALREFEARGLPAPEAIGLVERRPRGILRASYLLTHRIEGAENLAQYLHRNFVAPALRGEPVDGARLRSFTRQFAGAVRELHEAGVRHRDLKGENVLIADEDGKLAIRFIDFDSLYFARGVSFRRAAKNLAQLAGSLPYCFPMAARLRFFACYTNGSLLAGRRKELLRAAAAIAQLRIERWLRKWSRGRKSGAGR
ncbi:MAG: hypothetical protein GYA73_13105, partial [Planctomycetes bacterium]|nr:hypothetical protein [Planctomycetota bacterium]